MPNSMNTVLLFEDIFEFLLTFGVISTELESGRMGKQCVSLANIA